MGKNWLGNYKVYELNGKKSVSTTVIELAKRVEAAGAGELMINSIDRDGTMGGYDIDLIKQVSSAVKIPVIANGGAGSTKDFGKAIKEGGASAVAAGSMFVFQMPHKAVLITYPDGKSIDTILAG